MEPHWTEILQHLEWVRGFTPLFVFVPADVDTNTARDAMDRALRERVSALQTLTLDDGSEIPPLLQQLSAASEFQAMSAPAWLDMHVAIDDKKRAETLTVLEEHLSSLERHCPRPLLILLPLADKELVVRSAARMWDARLTEVVIPASTAADGGEESPAAPDFSAEAEIPAAPAQQDFLLTERSRAWLAQTSKESMADGLGLIDALRKQGQTVAARDLAMAVAMRAEALCSDAAPISAQREYCIALNKLGDLQFALQILEQAQQCFTESLTIRRRLLEKTPANLRHNTIAQRDVSLSLNKLGDVAQAQGDLTTARKLFSESLAIRQELKAAEGDTAQNLRDVSVCHNKLGELEQALDNPAAARMAFQHSLQLRRQLCDSDTNNPAVLRDLSIGLNRLGEVEQSLGNFAAAQTAFAESSQLRRSLLTHSEDKLTAQRDLSLTLCKEADVAMLQGDSKTARQRYDEALPTIRHLAASNPQQQRTLIGICGKLGSAEMALDNADAAALLFNEQLTLLRERLVTSATSPFAAEDQRQLASALLLLAEAEEHRHRLPAAEALLAENLAWQRETLERSGKTVTSLMNLTAALNRLARLVMQDKARQAAARELLDEAVVCGREGLHTSGGSPDAVQTLASVLQQLADLARDQQQYPLTRQYCQESLDMLRQLRQRYGEQASYLRSLAVALSRLATVDTLLDKPTDALASLAESVALRRSVRRAENNSADSLVELANALTKLGTAEWARKQFGQARQIFAESLDLHRQRQAILGDTADTLRHLALALAKLGDADLALAQYATARHFYRESLALRKRLVAAFPQQNRFEEELTRIEEKLLQMDADHEQAKAEDMPDEEAALSAIQAAPAKKSSSS